MINLIERLKRESDFNKIFSKGKRSYAKSLAMLYLKSEKLKIGFCVSKKHGNAVTRNRIKRLLRAAAREAFEGVQAKILVVFMPKVSENYEYGRFVKDMKYILEREGLK